MVGSVGGGVFLDSDLGNMLDLVVNLVTNVLDNRGSGIGNWGSNMVSSWGSNMVSSWGSNMVSSWGSIGIGGSKMVCSWGSNMVCSWSSNMVGWGNIMDNWDSLGNGVNKSIFINILRESLERKGSIATVSSNQITNSGSEWSRSST